MEIKDLKEGEIYSCIHHSVSDVDRCIFKATDNNHIVSRLTYGQSRFWNSSNFNHSLSKIQKATEEEKHWLNECIKANKFIPLEEALKSFKQETKFIIGQWYLFDANTYIKCSNNKINNACISVNERIYNGKLETPYCKKFHITRIKKEIPLSKIQAYLPEGHVDKINTTMKQELTSLPEKWCFKVTKENYEQFKHLRDLCSINGYISSKPYSGLSWGIWYSNFPEDCREITFDQFKKWVLKESVEEIPEYVELYKSGWDHEHLNEIWKTSDEFPKGNKNWTPTWTWKYLLTHSEHSKYFRASTASAYNAQFKKEEPVDLLAEAKRRYPIGTEYYGIKYGKKIKALYEPTLRTTGHYSGIKEGVVGIEVNEDYVYLDGVWAKTVSEAKQPEYKWVEMNKPNELSMSNAHNWGQIGTRNHLGYLGTKGDEKPVEKEQLYNVTIKKSKVQQVEVVPLQKPCIISTKKSKLNLIKL